jgi:hypothetical protein
LAAVAAAITIAVGVGMVMSSGPFISPSRQTPPPAPRTPLVDGFPAEVVGLPVISVSEAIARRDAGPRDTELAVAGTITRTYPAPSCPYAPTVSPVQARCPDQFGSFTDRAGGALTPLFRVDVPWLPAEGVGGRDGDQPFDAVLIGHFDDHRSVLCPADERETCRRAFVVDGWGWIDGAEVTPQVVQILDRWNESAQVSQTLKPRLTAQQAADIASGAGGAPLAPPWVAVMTDQYLPNVDPRVLTEGLLSTAEIVWVVREITDDGGRPVARTMFVDDATDRLFISGTAGITAIVPVVEGNPPTLFPGEVHGLPVMSVDEALAQPREGPDGLIDTEFAVRGYFIVPPTAIACLLPRDDIEPLPPGDRTCPEGLSWLMDEPERPWDVVDGVSRWHRPIRPTLYLEVGADIPFDIPQLFRDTSEAEPVPVVVVGHFGGAISPLYRDQRDFVVDALVWRLGEPSPNEMVVVGPAPAEDRAVVEARVEEATGPARVMWAAVVPGRDAAGVDTAPDGELVHAAAVWKITRLIEEAGRPVVRIAYTADGGHRVWESGGLAPERRLPVLGPSGVATKVAVIDDPDIVEAIRIAAAGEPGPETSRVITKEVPVPFAASNPTGRPNELRVHWTGTDCDIEWILEVGWDRRSVYLRPIRREDCQAIGVDIDIVLTLSQPIPVGSLTEGSIGAGG